MHRAPRPCPASHFQRQDRREHLQPGLTSFGANPSGAPVRLRAEHRASSSSSHVALAGCRFCAAVGQANIRLQRRQRVTATAHMNPTAPSHGPALRVLEADVVGLGPEETQASVAEAALARASKRLLSLQEPQGWWRGELATNVTM